MWALILSYGVLASAAPLYGGSRAQSGLTQECKSANADVGKPAWKAETHHPQSHNQFGTTWNTGLFSPVFFVPGLKLISIIVDRFGHEEPVLKGPPSGNRASILKPWIDDSDDNGWNHVDK